MSRRAMEESRPDWLTEAVHLIKPSTGRSLVKKYEHLGDGQVPEALGQFGPPQAGQE